MFYFIRRGRYWQIRVLLEIHLQYRRQREINNLQHHSDVLRPLTKFEKMLRHTGVQKGQSSKMSTVLMDLKSIIITAGDTTKEDWKRIRILGHSITINISIWKYIFYKILVLYSRETE